MNVRLGFARLARVTAILYWVASLLIVSIVLKEQWDQRRAELHPQRFTVEVADGRVFVLPARYEWEASATAREYAKANPIELTDEQVFGPPSQAGSGSDSRDVSELSDAELFALLRETDPDAKVPPTPIRLSVAKYENPRSLAAIVTAGAVAAMWCALVYAGLWVVFRSVRWVALGFMEGRGTSPSG